MSPVYLQFTMIPFRLERDIPKGSSGPEIPNKFSQLKDRAEGFTKKEKGCN